MFGGTNLVVRMNKVLSAPTYIVFNMYFLSRVSTNELCDFDNTKFSEPYYKDGGTCSEYCIFGRGKINASFRAALLRGIS